MNKKIYAVQKGAIPGIYSTWVECQQQINGFSGAIYKSFKNNEIDLAQQYINGDVEVKSASQKEKYYVILEGHEPGIYDNWDKAQLSIKGYPGDKFKSFKNKDIAEEAFQTHNLNIISDNVEKEMKENYDLVLFTDGGSNKDKVGGYAFILLYIKDGEIVKEKEFAKGLKNVTNNAMEMTAITEGLSYLIEKGVSDKKIGVYSDSKFAIESILGKYNQSTLKDLSKIAYSIYDTIKSNNDVELNHINSHIGIKYNEEVDELVNLEKDKIYKDIENDRILKDYSREEDTYMLGSRD